MDRSETIGQLAAALAKAQGRITAARKDGLNPHLKTRYATLDSIWDACREPLSENGLSVVQTVEPSDPGTVALATMLLHESGEWISSISAVSLSRDDAQGFGTALTYLRRYTLPAMVGVAPGDDDDGEAQKIQPAPATPRQQKPPTPAPPQPPPANGERLRANRAVFAAWNEYCAANGLDSQTFTDVERRDVCAGLLGLDLLESFKDLSVPQLDELASKLLAARNGTPEAPPEEDEDPFDDPSPLPAPPPPVVTATTASTVVPPAASEPNGSVCAVPGCGVALKPAARVLSTKKYGMPLCPEHQKESQPV